MTCVAWDGTTLAADRRALVGGVIRTTTKIHRVGDSLVAFSGDAAMGRELVEWYERGAKPEEFPEQQREKDKSRLLAIGPRKEIWVHEDGPYPILFEDEFFAIGSGRDYALAAMHLGCNAVQAVEVAAVFSSECGNGFDVLVHAGKQ